MDDDNREFCQSVDNVTLQMLKVMEHNVERGCLIIERAAKINCADIVDYGHLRASITHDVSVTTKDITGRIYSNLDYAPYIEKGTGVHAKDGDGRKTPWYVPVDGYAGTKHPTFEGKVVIVYGKKGKKFYKTDGMKPRSFLEPARDENKAKVLKALGGK